MSKMTKIIIPLVQLVILFNCANAYRIFCPYPSPSRSHFIVAEALFKGLAAKGHEVTVLSAFPPDQPITNYRHITLELVSNHDELMKQFVKNPGDMGVSVGLIKTLAQVTVDETRAMLTNPQVQKIMAEENFDLVIIEFLSEPQIGFAAHFNCPVILIGSIKAPYRMLDLMGNPLALSYINNPLYPWADLSRFSDRVLNMVLYFITEVVQAYFKSMYKACYDEMFPSPKYPSYDDVFANNVAAVFATDHFSQGDVRPLVPGIIEISGIQMTETATPLPGTLQSWMDQSTNGVIFFSLGSNLKVSSLSPAMIQAILNVFKNTKLNVLWKSDVTKIPGISSNVWLEKWVSQIDVLHHKNTKLFITHGGFGSITESKFYGVPVLVIPMFADQIPNADVAIAEGWGVKLLYAEFTEQRFTSTLMEVLENQKYFERAKYQSMLFRDRPLTALQTGIYWVEYIIRHKGAHHMRSNATQLNWFQLHSLDVIGFLLLVLSIWAYVSYKIMKCLVRKVFGGKISKLKRN